MKKIAILLTALLTAGAAQAEEMNDDPSRIYIASLCTVISQEKAPSTADDYVRQMRDIKAQGTSPYSVNEDGFNEDEARTVAAAWMNLSDEEKQQARKNDEACHTAIQNEYQSQD